MSLQNCIPDVKEDDFVVYTKGKSKSLLRGIPYKVSKDLKVKNVKGRGLTFKKFEKPDLPSLYWWNGSSRAEKFLVKHLPDFRYRINSFRPSFEKDDIDTLYISLEGERRNMKTGRALRKIFPELPDPGIETLVDLIKDEFGPVEYSVVRTNNPEEISSLARKPISRRRSGFYTSTMVKSLSASCMRYKFSNLELHPYAAYGAKDFEVIFLQEPNGHLAGRCVTIPKYNAYFPIYGVNTAAVEKLKSEVGAFKPANELELVGIEMYYNTDKKVNPMPYLDFGSTSKVDGKVLWSSTRQASPIRNSLQGFIRG